MHLTEYKNDLLKSRWLTQPRFRSQMKMDNPNRLADPPKYKWFQGIYLKVIHVSIY